MIYKPEGYIFNSELNQHCISTAEGLSEAMAGGLVIEARAAVCDSFHNLIIDLPCGKGIIPREEGAIGIAEGKTRDIALISRVNKIVCFMVTSINTDEYGNVRAVLSRKAAQEKCMSEYLSQLTVGDVIDAKVTHLEQFGAFTDIGCGVPSLIPIDVISVSRISHPSDRFCVGQKIKAVIKSIENGRICLSHKELLGTWEENAARFEIGGTFTGVVRSVEEYGIFVELAPNLAGLAEPREGIHAGQTVSVYIKAIIPEKMKIKLIVVDVSDEKEKSSEIEYFTNAVHISKWLYSPVISERKIGTSFI